MTFIKQYFSFLSFLNFSNFEKYIIFNFIPCVIYAGSCSFLFFASRKAKLNIALENLFKYPPSFLFYCSLYFFSSFFSGKYSYFLKKKIYLKIQMLCKKKYFKSDQVHILTPSFEQEVLSFAYITVESIDEIMAQYKCIIFSVLYAFFIYSAKGEYIFGIINYKYFLFFFMCLVLFVYQTIQNYFYRKIFAAYNVRTDQIYKNIHRMDVILQSHNALENTDQLQRLLKKEEKEYFEKKSDIFNWHRIYDVYTAIFNILMYNPEYLHIFSYFLLQKIDHMPYFEKMELSFTYCELFFVLKGLFNAVNAQIFETFIYRFKKINEFYLKKKDEISHIASNTRKEIVSLEYENDFCTHSFKNFKLDKTMFLIGPSGIGKSLFFKSIFQIYPSRGKAYLPKKKIFVHQEQYVPSFCTFKEALLYPNKKITNISAWKKCISFFKEFCMLFDNLNKKREWNFCLTPAEKAYLYFFKLAYFNYELACLDEIFAPLNLDQKKKIFGWLRENTKTAYIVISHDQQFMSTAPSVRFLDHSNMKKK